MKLREKYQLNDLSVDRIIEMAWEDRTPFDAIKAQFGVPEADVIALMRQEMHPRNWRKWRARVQGRATKHQAIREEDVSRFRSSRQRDVSFNRISKRNSR